ncbi:MAG: ORF6N domain-containing protein [Sulfuricaulis sp.]|uniref:ORF6N domain-containing protein n=1 Tax=Sulfuricaulis sp. TaxID=2003553 RepID=UPI003C40D8EA
MSGKNRPALAQIGLIEGRILVIRGQRVIVDADLAELYGTSTKSLNQAVRRNRDRFPGDFVFQLTGKEKAEVVTVCDHLKKLRFSSTLPYAFTEHGAIMAASVLNKPLAVEVSVYVVRAFVRLREMLISNAELARKLERLEHRLELHDGKLTTHDDAIATVLSAIRELMTPPEPPKKRRIGFIQDD